MVVLEELIKIRRIEKKISNNFFRICSLITIIVFILYSIEFFSRGEYPSPRIGSFYIGILILYSFHKEMLRWLGEKDLGRKGERFVYLWIFFTFSLYLINFFTKNYFTTSREGQELKILSEVTLNTLEVVFVFLITSFSKILQTVLTYKKRNKNNSKL